MSLPIPPRKEGTLNFHGEIIPLRSLTARELMDLRKGQDPHAINIAMIGYAFGMDTEASTAWYDAVDASDVLLALKAINVVSGLDEAAQFPDPAANDALDDRATVGD